MENIIINVTLNDLLDSTFRFYLDEKYKNKIFSSLKNIHKDWRIVAEKLNMPTRSLFGIRRGWEYRNKKTRQFPINAKWLRNIQNLLGLDIQEVERSVNAIKSGIIGNKSEINLPITIDFNKEPINTIRRAVAEHVFIKKYEKDIELFQLNKNLKKKDYIILTISIEKEIIDKLAKRGLCPRVNEGREDYTIYFKNPNVNKTIKRIIPKQVIFDEIFAKEFGKWYGDKCGGSHQVGITNTQENLVKAFYDFLINKLNQQKENVNFSLDRRKNNSYYRVTVSNKLLREKVFNFLENNIFPLLYNSKKPVRCAFYAGLFEADGSISPDRNDFVIASFGLDTKKPRTTEEILGLLTRVIKFNYLLKKDGFKSRISRKVANTKKSSTLKYDVRLILGKNSKDRIRFIKGNIFPYVIHKPKLNKFKEMGRKQT